MKILLWTVNFSKPPVVPFSQYFHDCMIQITCRKDTIFLYNLPVFLFEGTGLSAVMSLQQHKLYMYLQFCNLGSYL